MPLRWKRPLADFETADFTGPRIKPMSQPIQKRVDEKPLSEPWQWLDRALEWTPAAPRAASAAAIPL